MPLPKSAQEGLCAHEKKRIIFLPIPESCHRRIDALRQVPEGLQNRPEDEAQYVFQINPDIPVPVEIPEDETGKKIILENLSMEMILAGMLKVIEDGEERQEWIEYYCRFVLFLRPDIMAEIKKIRDSGLEDESYKKAVTLLREGKAEEGLDVIRYFIERHPMVWNGWFLLGWALRLLGRWADGEAAFRKTIELGGGGSDTRNELAICLMENRDITGAKRELETALKLDPENEKIISNLQVVEKIILERTHTEAHINS